MTYTYVQPVTQLRNKCRIILPTGVSRGTYTEAKHAPSGRPADDGFGTVLRISGKIQGTVPEFTEFTLKHVGGATVRSEKTENGGVNVDAEFSEQPASGGDVFIEYVLREGSAPFFYYVPTGEKEAVAVFSFQPLLERTVSRPSGPDAPPSLNQIIRILVDKSGSMQMGRWSKVRAVLYVHLAGLLTFILFRLWRRYVVCSQRSYHWHPHASSVWGHLKQQQSTLGRQTGHLTLHWRIYER